VRGVVRYWPLVSRRELLLGGASHKDVAKAKAPWVLRLYYIQIVLFLVCSLNELFLLTLYGAAFGAVHLPRTHVASVDSAISSLLAKLSAFKPVDASLPPWIPVTVGWMMTVSFPVFAFKQLTSVVQMFWAMGRVAEYDQKLIDEKKKK
jgi:hypothetical protein